jgi:hypothetical protein
LTEAVIAGSRRASPGSGRVDTAADCTRSEKDQRETGTHPLDIHREASGFHWIQALRKDSRLKLLLLLAFLIAGFVSFEDGSSDGPEIVTSAIPPKLWKNAAVALSTPTPLPSGVMQVLQVHQPVLTPSGLTGDTDPSSTPVGENCTVLLMEHSFAWSYGIPFVGRLFPLSLMTVNTDQLGNYTPPACKFNRVVMNFTVTSRGRQFDRLALMYLGDTEVWRTSTAEPTANGIEWTYLKDMTEYLYLWKQSQKIIFDLGNIVDNTYTGIFHTTLTATFFTADDINPADLILPISARKSASSSASLFMVPADRAASTIDFPRNVNRAVFSISACGQAAEEFWWSNVFSSNTDTFTDVVGTLYGLSPWREVQVYIDGQLAGVQWPFPVIFTGGVVPGLWRPIVAIDAFDLREHEIDITPFLPLLCDGAEHTFEIKVAGISDDGGTFGATTEPVGNSWYVTGKIFLWLDDTSSITTGTPPVSLLPPPAIRLSQSLTTNTITGANETLSYKTAVTRTLAISSLVKTQHSAQVVKWTQSLSYTNIGLITSGGQIQANTLLTTGRDQSTGVTSYKSLYSYPLYVNSSYIVDPSGSGNFSLGATLSQGLNLEISGLLVFPTGLEPFTSLPKTSSVVPGLTGSYLNTELNGTASYFASPSTGTGYSFGSTEQEFYLGGVKAVSGNAGGGFGLYSRHIKAVNATVVQDDESLAGDDVGSFQTSNFWSGGDDGVKTGESAVRSLRELLGRGPGNVKKGLAQPGA